jgi:hypothetical protein
MQRVVLSKMLKRRVCVGFNVCFTWVSWGITALHCQNLWSSFKFNYWSLIRLLIEISDWGRVFALSAFPLSFYAMLRTFYYLDLAF